MKRGHVLSVKKIKALVRKMVEEVNKENITVLDEFLALNFIDHTSQIRGREKIKQEYVKWLKNHPDLHMTIEDIIAEENKVWYLEKDTGIDSSCKKIDTKYITILRIVDGKAGEGCSGYLQETHARCALRKNVAVDSHLD